jgi:hypothetical protein
MHSSNNCWQRGGVTPAQEPVTPAPYNLLQLLMHSVDACAIFSQGEKLGDREEECENKNWILARGVGQAWASAEVAGDDAIRDSTIGM